MIEEICQTIKERKLLNFYYDGGLRTVEPYCYGLSKKNAAFLRAYQISGYSKSGTPSGWKLLNVSKISNISISEESFRLIRPEYNPNDPIIVKIYCRI